MRAAVNSCPESLPRAWSPSVGLQRIAGGIRYALVGEAAA